MFHLTDDNMNDLFSSVEEQTDLRFFVQAGEIVVYHADDISSDAIEDWMNTEPRPETPEGVATVCAYSDAAPKLVFYEEGGLIRGYSASVPVEIVEVNYDTEDVSSAHTDNEKWGGDYLITYIHGRETAVYAPTSADVRPEQVACIHALAHAHYDEEA